MKNNSTNAKWKMENGSEKLRVAIVHDWLVGGGAELVVEQLHELFPDAPVYTSYATKEWRKRLDGKVKTGWLQPSAGFANSSHSCASCGLRT